MGKNLLTGLLILSIIATAIADLGFMHASNEAWPPHARLHAIWNVVHVTLTHGIALALLWIDFDTSRIVRARVAVAIFLAYILSFFGAALLSSLFGASTHPDLPLDQRPPTIFGMDGNMFGFLLALPVIAYAWWSCEKQEKQGTASPVTP